MNAKQIKTEVILTEYLQSIGVYPTRKYAEYWLYHCPFRKDEKPSFSVNLQRNRWMDFSSGQNGDVIDLVRILHNTDTTGAIAILSGNSTQQPAQDFFSFTRQNNFSTIAGNSKPITVTHTQRIQNKALISYLHERNIPVLTASRYLQEVYFISGDRKRQFFSLGMQNDDGGWALRNRYAKTAVSPAGITSVPGSKKHEINVFEGFFDFLSYLTFYDLEAPDYDSIVLNSTIHLPKAGEVLFQYQQVNLWLDNDDAGRAAVDLVKHRHSNAIHQSARLFPQHKDFNEFLMNTH